MNLIDDGGPTPRPAWHGLGHSVADLDGCLSAEVTSATETRRSEPQLQGGGDDRDAPRGVRVSGTDRSNGCFYLINYGVPDN